MLKHIVMYKLKNNTEAQCQELKEKFFSMKKHIPQLVFLDAGSNIIESDRAFDFVLICDFATREDLNIYLDHPIHQKVREYVHQVIAKAHSVDYLY